jgi:hypothetical protein
MQNNVAGSVIMVLGILVRLATKLALGCIGGRLPNIRRCYFGPVYVRVHLDCQVHLMQRVLVPVNKKSEPRSLTAQGGA